MPEISEFTGLDTSGFDVKYTELQACKDTHHVQNCSECKIVAGCEKIKSFVTIQFEFAKKKLSLCQSANSRSSCLECESFFSCQIRQDYVRSTYEKMNEGKGGEFDF